MADPNKITLRSDKDTFLTFEEMDTNLDVLKDAVADVNLLLSNVIPSINDNIGNVLSQLSEYKVEVNQRFLGVVSTDEENTFTKPQSFVDEVTAGAFSGRDIVVRNSLRLARWRNTTRPNNPEEGTIGFNYDIPGIEEFSNGSWKKLQDAAPTKTEARQGTVTGFRRWSPLRIRDAIVGWWEENVSSFARELMEKTSATAMRQHLGLGTAATRGVGTSGNNLMQVGAGGLLSSATDGVPNTSDANTYINVTRSRINLTAGSDASVNYGSGLFLDSSNETKRWLILGATEPRVFYKQYRGISSPNINTVEMITTGNLKNERGQSTEFPMSQKAATDAFQTISDIRDKRDIKKLDYGLDLIEKIDTIQYRIDDRNRYVTDEISFNDVITDGRKADSKKTIGLNAQQLLELDELKDTSVVSNYRELYEVDDDKYIVDYNQLVPILINAVKELNSKVNTLQEQLDKKSN